MKVQRFKPALTCGAHNPENPEDLIRDDNGEYMKYEDYKNSAEMLIRMLDNLTNTIKKSI